MINKVLHDFGIDANTAEVNPLQQGLINNTWKIDCGTNSFIIQKINNQIFKNPEDIADNIVAIAKYLAIHHPEYLFVTPIASQSGKHLIQYTTNEYYRAFPFVKNSHAKSVLTNPNQAYEAAKQFGRFTMLLNQFDAASLKKTIPQFHNLSLRYQQFNEALANGNKERIAEANDTIEALKNLSNITTVYNDIITNPNFKVRVTHHDTKISNVLFDDADKGICVIDLDTTMPGYFISDVGDMMRTYLCAVSEEETDFSKIEIRVDYYQALVQGYMEEMKTILTNDEKEHIFYAGTFMIYMQALRFLTDYLNDDVYYGAKYPKHNLNRAIYQLTLLQALLSKKEILQNIN